MSEGFLNRWSRIKQTGEEALPDVDPHDSEANRADSDVRLVQNAELAEQEDVTDQAATEVEPLTDEDMPDIDTIDSRSDMSAFFSTGVSSELKRQALRKYFHQPEFNFRDPLDEYNLDYSQPKKLVAVVGEKVRGWAEQQLEDAMQQARDSLAGVEADRQKIAVDESAETVGPDRPEKTTQEETK
ncbi:DUF3306 domain-containing protein [Nitrincola sp.]|uniref:DUF3306 domain-containing protein n=1 Tax=Nitrincola sp. TaxID=1926584 RepID=UPI003A946602